MALSSSIAIIPLTIPSGNKKLHKTDGIVMGMMDGDMFVFIVLTGSEVVLAE